MDPARRFLRSMPISARIAAERIARRRGVPVEKVVASYLGAAKNFYVNSDSLFLGDGCYNANDGE